MSAIQIKHGIEGTFGLVSRSACGRRQWALLLDALRRVVAAADIVGVRAVLVHAKDEAARRFQEHFNFDPSPADPLHLYLLVKEVVGLIESP